MRSLSLKIILTLMTCSLAYASFGQAYLEDPKWGDNPDDRLENVTLYNLFRDTYNNQQYNDAVPYLQQLIDRAPRSSANLYVYGSNIYKNKAARATSVAEKNGYIDSLMMMYDLRSEYFGDDPERGTPYILTLKAIDYRDYRPADRETIRRYFRDALDASGENTEPDFINVYFNELTEDYKADEIEMDEYMSEYDRLEAILKNPANIANVDAQRTLEALFVTSGAANCDNIESMYSKRIADNPRDKEMLAKAVTLLERANCRGDFFMQVAELYYEVEPSAVTAQVLAAGYEQKNEYAKALEFLEAAYANETDPEQKHNLAIRMASASLASNNARAAADHARQAISINPDSGLAYYMLGQAYASGASQCSDFNRSAAYWLVYDTLVKAKSLMNGDAQVANIDQEIGRFRASFPSSEECFFRGLSEGDGYTVNCGWVSGRTTVRIGR